MAPRGLRYLFGFGGAFGAAAGFTTLYAKDDSNNKERKHSILIVGGGTGGIAVAAQLLRHRADLDVAIIDPSKSHYYQPGWTLVGAGLRSFEWSERPFDYMVPAGAKHINDKVVKYDPSNNAVVTAGGSTVKYDQLVVASGIELNWKTIPGLYEAMFDKDGKVRSDSPVVSNYVGGAETFKALQRFPDGGTALFTTSPNIKCGGAPIKACLLSNEYLHKKRSISAVVEFFSPGPSVFPMERYTKSIEALFSRRGVPILVGHRLAEVKLNASAAAAGSKPGEAVFETSSGQVRKPFDLLHVVPPMRTTAELRDSVLVDATGYMDVNKNTCQSTKFKNVWGVGDATNLPTSKTSASAIAQAPVVVHNVLTCISCESPPTHLAKYSGYSSCPLVFGSDPKSLLLMEFGYGGTPMESFGDPRDCDGTWRGMMGCLLKEYLFPSAYWHMLPRGMWFGPSGPCRPTRHMHECSLD